MSDHLFSGKLPLLSVQRSSQKLRPGLIWYPVHTHRSLKLHFIILLQYNPNYILSTISNWNRLFVMTISGEIYSSTCITQVWRSLFKAIWPFTCINLTCTLLKSFVIIFQVINFSSVAFNEQVWTVVIFLLIAFMISIFILFLLNIYVGVGLRCFRLQKTQSSCLVKTNVQITLMFIHFYYDSICTKTYLQRHMYLLLARNPFTEIIVWDNKVVHSYYWAYTWSAYPENI